MWKPAADNFFASQAVRNEIFAAAGDGFENRNH
jgi:hypothetical protein